MTVDIRTELARRALLIIQDAISQNAVPVIVQQTKFLISILSSEIENLEDSEKTILENCLNILEEKYKEFMNPSIKIEDVVPAEQQMLMVESKRKEIANEIYNVVNDIIKKLIIHCRGVFG
ncbi:hypothetical protein [Methanocaldococcus sp.]